MISALLTHSSGDPAIVSSPDGLTVTYGQLRLLVEQNEQLFRAAPRPALAVLYCGSTIGSIGAYLGALAAGLPLCLAEPTVKSLTALADHYRPSHLIVPSRIETPEGYRDLRGLADGEYRLLIAPERAPYCADIHPALALLLTTSGSTGSAKLVRLSLANLIANARSIAAYLDLRPGERSIQSLPMQYSYGLSLINSHLLAGGTVVLTKHFFMRPEFWADFDQAACTSLAGVPHMYEVLHRLRLDPTCHPTLETMTQAGGGLRRELIAFYQRAAAQRRKRFFVMYGQTEATARISYVPPARLHEKIGSIGVAIPDGSLRLERVDDDAQLQQLVYQGPNVMLGYAEGPEDLALGDVQRGILRTGDLAVADDEGFFYLVGRLNRFAKVFGRRINLADIESEVQARFPCQVAAAERHGRLHLFVETMQDLDLSRIRAHVVDFLGITPVAVRLEFIDSLPMTASGKKDYKALPV